MLSAILGIVGMLASSMDDKAPTAVTPSKETPSAVVTSSPAVPALDPKDGESIRVGGDLAAKVEKNDQGWYVDRPSFIDTPLPVGYPAPTPVGAIEIKRYPTVRRAEVTGTMAPNLGMNFAFFPLFNHIKSRSIAMTSPVEMNFTGADKPVPDGGDAVPDSWTMSFLYRSADLGPTGQDGSRKNVQVVDVPALTVISLGVRGGYDYARMRNKWQELEKWIENQSVWASAGEPRVLYYNGPSVRNSDKWAEVQIPITLAKPSPEPAPAAPDVKDAGKAPGDRPAAPITND